MGNAPLLQKGSVFEPRMAGSSTGPEDQVFDAPITEPIASRCANLSTPVLETQQGKAYKVVEKYSISYWNIIFYVILELFGIHIAPVWL